MTDNTPGTRDEKHTAADFATAKFARDPGGDATAHRTPMGFWTSRTFHGIDDEAMALGGWSPVRECPDPDGHTLPGIARAVAAVTPCSCSAQRARAEKAEKERDEALYQRDQWIRANDSTRNILDEAIEERRRIARALDLPEAVTADRMVARIEEVNGAGRTVTDEMVRRAKAELETRAGGDYYPETIEAVLTAALTEPPQRPEGAEEIESQVEAWEMREGGMSSLGPKDLRELADFLASRGVRVVGEERS